jgi:hypothetical protein
VLLDPRFDPPCWVKKPSEEDRLLLDDDEEDTDAEDVIVWLVVTLV